LFPFILQPDKLKPGLQLVKVNAHVGEVCGGFQRKIELQIAGPDFYAEEFWQWHWAAT
jgi:hypothetical protein